jgi:hypothetical protein
VAWQPRYSEVAGASSTESRVRHQARINRRELTVAVGRRGRRKRGAARRRLTAVRVLRWPAVDVQLALVSWRWATGCGRGWSAASAPRRPVPCEEVEVDGGVSRPTALCRSRREKERERRGRLGRGKEGRGDLVTTARGGRRRGLGPTSCGTHVRPIAAGAGQVMGHMGAGDEGGGSSWGGPRLGRCRGLAQRNSNLFALFKLI